MSRSVSGGSSIDNMKMPKFLAHVGVKEQSLPIGILKLSPDRAAPGPCVNDTTRRSTTGLVFGPMLDVGVVETS